MFATAFEQHAIDAFALAATDYLLKPITRSRLAGTLARLRARLSSQTDLDREMLAASAAQAHLFPRALPTIAGFDYAAVTVPAGAVGGDFYLAQPLSGGRLALALGDVSDKGMPAGLVASSVQARLETIARQGEWRATEVIADLNRALVGTIESARFATLAYVEIGPASGAIEVVNAGHPALISVAPGGGHRFFSSTGPALGVLPDASFTHHVLTLAPHELLVAYSDGMSECLDDRGEEFGEARITLAIEGRQMLTAFELCRTLVDLTRAYRGGAPPADDVTVLVIKRAAA